MNILRIAAALVALAGFIGSGCASNRGRPQVTVLRDPLALLKQQFNANASKPRVIALFSPTCGRVAALEEHRRMLTSGLCATRSGCETITQG